MGREYSLWIDLRLIKHMEVVILKNYLTKVSFLSKSTFLTSTKRSKKVQWPSTDFLGQKIREGGRADLTHAGVKKLSSFILTLMVKKEHGG